MKHSKEFVPSPKRPKKTKSKKKTKAASGSGLKVEVVQPPVGTDMDVDEWHEEQEVERSLDDNAGSCKRKKGAQFGSEATNRLGGDEGDDDDLDTPLKRQRVGGVSDDGDWEPPVIPKKSKKAVAK